MKKDSGQVALIVLLVMVVMLTLGVSIAQRGVADVRISQQEEDSARAFQAAETGVEQALSTLSGGEGSFGEDTSYEVTVAQGGASGFTSGQAVTAGETLIVNLEGASVNLTGFDIYFIEKGRDDCDTSPAAVEASVVYKPGSDMRVRREGFDVVSRGNSFDVVSKGSYSFEGKTFCAKATVSLTGNDIELRVKPLYSQAVIGVDPRPDTATVTNDQFLEVDSVGQTTGGVTRAVTVRRGLPQLPPIFDYVLFSGGGIIKGE